MATGLIIQYNSTQRKSERAGKKNKENRAKEISFWCTFQTSSMHPNQPNIINHAFNMFVVLFGLF